MADTNKTHTLSFRLAEDDYQKLVERCREADLTQSKYLRYLIRIPVVTDGDHAEDVPCLVLDRKSLARISKELTRWGYHYGLATLFGTLFSETEACVPELDRAHVA